MLASFSMYKVNLEGSSSCDLDSRSHEFVGTSTFYSKSILKPEKKIKEKFEPRVQFFLGTHKLNFFEKLTRRLNILNN